MLPASFELKTTNGLLFDGFFSTKLTVLIPAASSLDVCRHVERVHRRRGVRDGIADKHAGSGGRLVVEGDAGFVQFVSATEKSWVMLLVESVLLNLPKRFNLTELAVLTLERLNLR